MENKPKLKKAIFLSIFIIIIFAIVFFLLQYYQYKTYTVNLNNKIASIISEIKKQYPDIDNNDLMYILNSKDDANIDLFKSYGIQLDKDAMIIENDKYFSIFSVINLMILLTLSLIILFIFLIYNFNKDKKINEITKYIEELNNKNYRLHIEDNTEDELSILKNEIYKTTIMLKEVAENEISDKINLKDSLSDISHQLKTPLSSITIMLDNIIDNPQMDEETRISFIKDIKRQIININFLVDSLLKLSKLDSNSITFINKKEYIYNIIDESIKNVSVLCDLKNIQINKIGNDNAQIYCDMKWQIEAITNILKNCVEHTIQDSSINITYNENKVYSKMEIQDKGIGISKKDLPHIFERFYKGENSKSDSVGIGLALSKAIIEKNNGYIGVESQVGKGTSFVIKYFK